MNKYPCKECIVRCNCSSICSEVTNSTLWNSYSITDEHRCPDCGMRLIDVHEVSKSYCVISCVYCNGRFAIEFLINSIMVIRSIIPKGGMIKGFPCEVKTISSFIEEHWRTTKYDYE
jgi:hypothetical protein